MKKKKLKNVETFHEHEISNLACRTTINLRADFILLGNENCSRLRESCVWLITILQSETIIDNKTNKSLILSRN
ncbi:hypothetical protein QLX08_001644 [Tetragonisca angustula]|uniref:Uncharacterized protein n=1 Tax=Tetragonisca angustula TaxID=166442 RepID=A0AAW1AEF7_9HYME